MHKLILEFQIDNTLLESAFGKDAEVFGGAREHKARCLVRLRIYVASASYLLPFSALDEENQVRLDSRGKSLNVIIFKITYLAVSDSSTKLLKREVAGHFCFKLESLT